MNHNPSSTPVVVFALVPWFAPIRAAFDDISCSLVWPFSAFKFHLRIQWQLGETRQPVRLHYGLHQRAMTHPKPLFAQG